MKNIFSHLKENISRSNNHRVVMGISVFILIALILCQLRTCLPSSKVLHLGIFSGSNWDVPESSTYEVVDEVIARFEESHPGMKVEYTSGIVKDDYSTWLSDQIVRGSLPGVFMILDEDFNMLASLGALKDLDSYISKDPTVDLADYYENAWLAGQYESDQYALPYQSNLRLMFVNTTLLEKENIPLPDWDWTLDDFAKICEQVTRDTDNDGMVDQCGFANYTWEDMIQAYGIQIFEGNGTKANINNDSVRQALRNMQELREYDQAFYPFTDTTGFDSGKVAFAPMSYAEYKTYNPYPWKVRKYSSFNWSVLPMPASQSGGSSANLDSLMMGISSTTDHPNEAWQLLKLFVQDEETQQSVVDKTGGLSPLRNFSDSTNQFEEQEAAQDLAGLLDYAIENSTCKVRFKKYEDAMDLLDNSMNEIMNGNGDISLQLLELERRINDYLRN